MCLSSWMGIALQGTVSNLSESINMNNECQLVLMDERAYFVPASIVVTHARTGWFSLTGDTGSEFF